MLEMNPSALAKGDNRYSPKTHKSTFVHPDTIPTAGSSSGSVTQPSGPITQLSTSVTQPVNQSAELYANFSDNDSMNVDVEGTASNSLNQSPTLISTESGKRKALSLPDEDEASAIAIPPSQLPTFVGSSSHSAMSAQSAPPSTSASSARGSSAPSKRQRPSKNAEAAASMRSSRQQSVRSVKQETHISASQAQQLVHSTVNLEKMLADNLQGQNADPIGEVLVVASAIINRNELGLSIDDRVDLTDALTKDSQAATMFNSSADNEEFHRAYVRRILENYRKDRA